MQMIREKDKLSDQGLANDSLIVTCSDVSKTTQAVSPTIG